MKSVVVSSRSYEQFTPDILDRLSLLAEDARRDFFRRNPRWLPYSSRVLCVALAQGGALHFVDGKNGVTDLDVWTFYDFSEALGHFAYRLRHKRDLGPSQFGRHPDDEGFKGRRVDLFGRAIPHHGGDGIISVQRYLREGATKSASLLAQKPLVLLDPAERRGKIIWRPA